jgi:hypothetical protein
MASESLKSVVMGYVVLYAVSILYIISNPLYFNPPTSREVARRQIDLINNRYQRSVTLHDVSDRNLSTGSFCFN